jgi:outer membrane receptor protein involved in Fe transport
VASVEVLYGPSSALYGANAFNGVVLTTSKGPFSFLRPVWLSLFVCFTASTSKQWIVSGGLTAE